MKMKGIIAGVITLALLLVASPAQADVIGGGGASSGGSTLSSGGFAPQNWDRVVGIWQPTGAYQSFLAAAVGNGNYGYFNSASQVEAKLSQFGILDQCKQARLILFLRDQNYGVWMFSTSGYGLTGEVSSGDWTTTPGYGHVFITERDAAGQPSWNQAWPVTSGQSISPQSEAMSYASTAPRNTNIICSWGAQQSLALTKSYSRNQATVSDSNTWTKPYSWSTSVQREISQGGIDPIGVNNLHDQAAVTTASNFAGVYNSLASSSAETESVAAKNARITAALASDANMARSNVALDANNQAGLAEGGVLSVYEHTTYATINAAQSTTWQRCNLVVNQNSWNGTNYVPTTLASGPTPWVDPACSSAPLVGGSPTFLATDTGAAGFPSVANGWRALATSYTNSKTMGTPQNTGFWQILSVHCNPTELNALLGSISGEKIVSQTTGVNGTSTTVLNTQKFDSRNAAFTANEILGNDISPLPTAVRRTGQIGFYDKECDLTCVSSPAATAGASAQNGATTNQSTTTNQGGKSYYGGALYNNQVNSNYLEIFRDNNDRPVSVNTAYPTNVDPQFKYGGTYPDASTGAGVVTVPADAPVSTTITRWSQGTPNSDSTQGGQFTMLAVGPGGVRTPIFQPTSAAPTPQLNFATNPYQTLNSTTLNGFYRDFIVKATWASEANKPQVINFKWEYHPTVWTTVPLSVGFGNTANSAATIANYVVKDQALDGRCYAQFGSYARNLNLAARVQASTGTGTTNLLDSDMLESVSGDNSWQTQSNLVLKFVRAVSE